jgi:hypothetical protein
LNAPVASIALSVSGKVSPLGITQRPSLPRLNPAGLFCVWRGLLVRLCHHRPPKDPAKLARLFAENFGGALGGTLLAASGCRIIRNMRTTKREQRVTVRLSDSLVGELKAEAVQDGRPLADYVRRLLVDAVAARVVQREQPTA